MNKVAVVLLMASSLLMAGVAEAAKPKKRTRNSNRVGPYGSAIVGFSTYGSSHAQNELDLMSSFLNSGVPSQNITASTQDTDLGYQATFGYRFNRYLATELSLAHFGEVKSTARGELDLGDGFVPASLSVGFSVGGPVFSMVGILPINDRFEFYGRAGMLLASSDVEVRSRVDGQSGGFGGAKGDSSNPVFGAGASWHFNQMLSVRAEYWHLGEVGQSDRTGKEELNTMNVGVVIRF
jgi:hypothetical protein